MDFINILNIVTADHFIRREEEVYFLTHKHCKIDDFQFSVSGAATAGDRGSWHKICSLGSIEKNLAGLAAHFSFCRNSRNAIPYDFQRKLDLAETDDEKQRIIQDAFCATDWKNLCIKSPEGNISVHITVRQGKFGKEIFCTQNSSMFLCALAPDNNLYNKLSKILFRMQPCLSFIEQYAPEADSLTQLKLIAICLTGEEHPIEQMAHDEVRHGKALQGLLERYFK